MYDGETRRCVPSAGCTLPAAQASTLCEVAALDEKDPAEPLSLYAEDYFAGHPAAAVHRYGKGRAYYLASRFDEAFYRAFYHDAAKEIGLSPAWPEALPEGVLAVRRGSFVFVQNCTEQPATVGNTVLDRYRTAVWKDMDRIFDKIGLFERSAKSRTLLLLSDIDNERISRYADMRFVAQCNAKEKVPQWP